MTATLDSTPSQRFSHGDALTARFVLREATRDAHDAVDRLFSRFRLDHIDGYARFLEAQAAAHVSVERGLDAAGAEAVLNDWPTRRRASNLLEDLARLDRSPPPPPASPRFQGEAAILGAIYVLEGSRLGGAVISRQLADGWPVTFLSAAEPGQWRSLTTVLDNRLSSPEDMDQSVASARAVFAVFEAAARRHLGADVA